MSDINGMKKYIVEFIGTFFLIMGAALYGAVGASLSLMIMVYAGGHISGAHYNPAVTLAIVLRGKASVSEAIAYWISQFLAAVAAGCLVLYVFQKNGGSDCMVASDAIGKGIVAEVLGTFALAYVILNVATTKGTSGNSFYGLAIGGTVLAMAITLGSYSGGAFNPAVALGLCIQKTFCWSQLWVYFVGCFTGGALAAIVFNYINEDDRRTPPIPPAE